MMEGAATNYADISGLDSIQAFTEEGLQLWHAPSLSRRPPCRGGGF